MKPIKLTKNQYIAASLIIFFSLVTPAYIITPENPTTDEIGGQFSLFLYLASFTFLCSFVYGWPIIFKIVKIKK